MKKFSLFASRFSKPKLGFTLAETLITLTLIGIIAALTVPALSYNYKKQLLITRAKHGHSVLQSALTSYMAKNKTSNLLTLMDPRNYKEYFTSGACNPKAYEVMAKKMAEAVSAFKVCEDGIDEVSLWRPELTKEQLDNKDAGKYKYCSTYGVKSSDGSDSGWFYNWQGRFYLINGTSYMFNLYNFDYDENGEEKSDGHKVHLEEGNPDSPRLYGYVLMDANGAEGPNQFGTDVFLYYITDKGKLLVGDWASRIDTILIQNTIYNPKNPK